jgi:hypothetical protein
MSRASAYLRGDAPEHSGQRREFPNLATNRFTEKTGYDQIQDPWRGSYSVADVRNAGVRAGGYPGAGRIRVLLSQQ